MTAAANSPLPNKYAKPKVLKRYHVEFSVRGKTRTAMDTTSPGELKKDLRAMLKEQLGDDYRVASISIELTEYGR